MPPLAPWMELNFWQVLSLLRPLQLRDSPLALILGFRECMWKARHQSPLPGRIPNPPRWQVGKKWPCWELQEQAVGTRRPLRRGCWGRPGFLGHIYPSCLWEDRESQPAAAHRGFPCPMSQQSGSNLETSLFPLVHATPTTPHPQSSCS